MDPFVIAGRDVHVAPDHRHRQVPDATRSWRRRTRRRGPRWSPSRCAASTSPIAARSRCSTTSIPSGTSCLPNTAACYTAEDAIRTARLGREAGLSNWVKLEVIGDEKTLFPDNEALLEATRVLVRGRLRRPALHQRRSGGVPQARRRGRGRGHAAGRADRLRPRDPEPEQPPDHQGAGARAGDRRCGRRHRVRCRRRHGAGRRRGADEHAPSRSRRIRSRWPKR